MKRLDNQFDESIRWEPIPNYEGIYWISPDGQIRNQWRLKRVQKSPKGYLQISLSRKGEKAKTFFVHRLVAQVYVENPCPELFNVVHHIDEDKSNANYQNLMWTDSYDNNTRGSALALKMDAKARKRKHKGKRTVLQIIYDEETDTFTGVKYPSIAEASKQTKINQTCISQACQSQTSKAGGFRWIYL